MSKTQLQLMEDIDEEKEFLKKLESMKITIPAPKIDKKTFMFDFEEKMKTSAGILQVRAERRQLMRNKCSGIKKRNEMKKRRRKSVRFAPMSRHVSGVKIEEIELELVDENWLILL